MCFNNCELQTLTMTNDTYTPIVTYIESTVVSKPLNCNVYAVKLFFMFILSSLCLLFVLYMSFSYCQHRCRRRRETQVDLVNFDNVL